MLLMKLTIQKYTDKVNADVLGKEPKEKVRLFVIDCPFIHPGWDLSKRLMEKDKMVRESDVASTRDSPEELGN